jgi:hypothetical protein
MSTSVSPKAKAIVSGLVALAAAVVTVLFGLRAMNAPATPASVPVAAAPVAPPAPPFVGPRSQDEARTLLAQLPELQSWSAHLQKISAGTVKGELVRFGPTPKTLNGKRYWQFSYVENQPDAARRWETFLVGENTPDILVDDLDTGAILTLAQWRTQKHPMTRIAPPPAVAAAPLPAAPATAQ